MGTEQLMNMFNKEEQTNNKNDSNTPKQISFGNNYQKIIENINKDLLILNEKLGKLEDKINSY